MTAIEWTDATWNPVTGCSKVSPGCAHCYAETVHKTRLSGRHGYPVFKPWTPANAAHNVVLRPDRLEQPMRWREPRMVFVNSMSDLFHELIPDDFVHSVFQIMERASQHTFQVLTKRPERARDLLRWLYTCTWCDGKGCDACDGDGSKDPLPNVWIGTSIENMRWVERADVLREIPAAVRFISAEPLLGPLLDRQSCGTCWDWPDPDCPGCEGLQWWWGVGSLDLTDIDWLIVGGESGVEHRPIEEWWVQDLRTAAAASDTAFFFKQWGGRTPKAGGRELDGQTWDEYPQVTS